MSQKLNCWYAIGYVFCSLNLIKYVGKGYSIPLGPADPAGPWGPGAPVAPKIENNNKD